MANLFRHHRPTGFAMANFPAPKQTKALPLPANHRRGADNENERFPAVPDRGEPCPEKAVSGAQLRALEIALEDAELMTARVRNEALRKAKKAVRTGPKCERLMGDKPNLSSSSELTRGTES